MTQNPLSDSESKKQTENKEYYQNKLENEIVGSQKVSLAAFQSFSKCPHRAITTWTLTEQRSYTTNTIHFHLKDGLIVKVKLLG